MAALPAILTSPVVIGAILLVACVVLLLKLRSRSPYPGKRLPPSLPSLPIVGSIPFVSGGMDVMPKKFVKFAKKLGPVFSFYSGSTYAVVVNGKTIYEALQKKSESFSDRPPVWTEANLLNVDQRGIVFATYNDALKKYRNLFLSVMKEFGFGLTQESDERIWGEAEQLVDSIRMYNGDPIDPRKMVLHSTVNASLNILFGQGFLEEETNQAKQIIKNAHASAESMDPAVNVLPFLRFLPPYKNQLLKAKTVQEDLIASIEAAIKHNKGSDSPDSSFTRRFLESEGKDYNHDDLVFMLRDLCNASSVTMVEVLLWLFLEMANYPHIQAQVQKELEEVVPESRFPSYDDILNLPFTEATILECARLHTLVPFSVVHQTSRDAELNGYFIPKHSLVIPNLYSIHMDPEIWTDPENFRPERFLDDHNKITGRENVHPFSVGPRSCLGEVIARQVIFVFFAGIVRLFHIVPPEEQNTISAQIKEGLTAGPTPFKVRFVRRRNKSLRRMSRKSVSHTLFMR